MTVTPEEFVKAWQSSESIQEVADKLDIKYAAAYKRAEYFRLRGVKLKPISRKPGIDVDTLNKLCDDNP